MTDTLPRHFLIIDDDEVDRIALTRRLNALVPAATISKAASPFEGLKALEESAIDCVLVDYDMPFCNGVSLINSIRNTPAVRDIPVIMVTGSDEVAVAVEAIRQGADEFLNKANVNDTTLCWAIHSACNRAGLRREAASREQALRNFAFHAAHDLKSPLTGIVGLAGLLQHSQDSLPDAARKALSRIEAQGRHMASLIDSLLDYADQSRGKPPVARVDLGQAARSAMNLLEDEIATSRARIALEDLPAVAGDPDQVERVFANLIQNAIKYRSDADPRISIRATELGHQVRIDIQDNGMGVPEHLRERIFDPLERGDARDQAGHGLGLAIIRRIVETHQGRVWCQPAPDGGSVFSFTLNRFTEG